MKTRSKTKGHPHPRAQALQRRELEAARGGVALAVPAYPPYVYQPKHVD